MAELLITGGAGFIGSHTCLLLLQAGHRLVVLDDFSNSSKIVLEKVLELAGLSGEEHLIVLQGDIRNSKDLDNAFKALNYKVDAVLHFAGLKAVGESVQIPLKYWDVNLNGSRCLLDAMQRHSCRTIVFSSSATIYGYPNVVPIPETATIQPINPYGYTKAAVERLLEDLALSEPGWRIAKLRYFNPVGAHSSGLIGEDPKGIPNNLFPFVSQVAIGRREKLEIWGKDWETLDGTCIRDYIHVMDLAEGHISALNVLLKDKPQVMTLNLGSGVGHSVLEVVNKFQSVCGKEISYTFQSRRTGDAACTIADPKLAELRLGWSTRRGLEEICRDSWAWQTNNPNGFKKE